MFVWLDSGQFRSIGYVSFRDAVRAARCNLFRNCRIHVPNMHKSGSQFPFYTHPVLALRAKLALSS